MRAAFYGTVFRVLRGRLQLLEGCTMDCCVVCCFLQQGPPSLHAAVDPSPWLQFKDVAVKVKSAETLYKGISFYLEEHPDLLNDLLKVKEWAPVDERMIDSCLPAGSWCGCMLMVR